MLTSRLVARLRAGFTAAPRRRTPVRLWTAVMVTAGAAALFPTGPHAARGDDASPRLIVMLVVDQMRADYVDRFRRDWTGGLKRLTQGARFTQAAYPYANTFTCAGHATIATGTLPYVHGIVQNIWFDRQRGDNIPCTRDGVSKAVPYSGTGRDDGPGLLSVPTLSDELRRQHQARVVSLSLKGRSAIMLAGHGGDIVTWLTESSDGWQTADVYSAAPVPVVQEYLAAHPVAADHDAVWDRLLPASRYPEADDSPSEAPPSGWTRVFPHTLLGEATAPSAKSSEARFRDLWQRSPWADRYLGQMAASLAGSLKLGTGSGPDYLAVSFSSPDMMTHQFGPHSQEVRDIYARLDRTIGQLFDTLDRLVGRDRYVVALTADHGVTDVPETARAQGRDAGRISTLELRNAIETAAVEHFGPGQYVARVNSGEVFFRPGVYELLHKQPGGLDAIVAMLENRPGIQRVLRSEQINGQTTSADRLIRAAALSFIPERNGDLLIVPKPGWVLYASGTTHGTLNPMDRRVPILLAGAGIRSGVYDAAATPADIAPTLAALAGVQMPKASGRVLREALRTRVSAATK